MHGSPQLKHYLIIFIVPITVLLVVLFGRFLPSSIHPAYLIVLAFAILIVFTVRTRLRAHEQAGLKPKKAGFSSKLDLLSQRLRQRAKDLEAAERFDREIEFLPSALTEFVEEIRKTAQQVHQKDLVPQLPSLLDEDSNIVEGLDEDEEEDSIPSSSDRLAKHTAALRQAASEIETYSNEVRTQGGVYKLAGGQLAGCSLMLLGCLVYGAYLVCRFHKSERWESWAGGGMILLALLFSYVLYRMQTEPA